MRAFAKTLLLAALLTQGAGHASADEPAAPAPAPERATTASTEARAPITLDALLSKADAESKKKCNLLKPLLQLAMLDNRVSPDKKQALAFGVGVSCTCMPARIARLREERRDSLATTLDAPAQQAFLDTELDAACGIARAE
jgi:hypothetical protein